MRMRIEPPLVAIESEGAFYVATMTLQYAGEALASGPCHAASRKTAEQQAAQRLLDLIAARDCADEVVAVTQEDGARLQANNPKGRLLEWCAQHQVPAPHYQQDASTAGYRVRGRLALAGGPDLVTPWFDAPKLKLGEQAAAESMLRNLPAVPDAAAAAAVAPTAQPATPTPTPDAGPNAAMALNELCQVGVLQTIGYEVVDQSGPSHQPTFVVVAWAMTPDGGTLRTDPVPAPSKKAAQRLAADRLLDRLVAAGLSRR